MGVKPRFPLFTLPLSSSAAAMAVRRSVLDIVSTTLTLAVFSSLALGLIALFSSSSFIESFIDLVRLFLRPFISSPDDLIQASAPLWLLAFAFSIPFKSGFFNIGGDGQVLAGAFASVATAFLLSGPRTGLALLLLVVFVGIVAAGLAGAAWAAVASFLREKLGVNEVISTLLLNLLALPLIGMFVGSGVLAILLHRAYRPERHSFMTISSAPACRPARSFGSFPSSPYLF